VFAGEWSSTNLTGFLAYSAGWGSG